MTQQHRTHCHTLTTAGWFPCLRFVMLYPMIFVAILFAIASSAGIYFAYKFLKERSASSVGAERDSYISQIEEADKEIQNLIKYLDSYASSGQFESITQRVDQVKTALEGENAKLKELEAKLDVAQTDVEGKESIQQELKTAKEEDEIALEKLLSSYSEVSDEAISLEQELAQSMRNLDGILEEVELTEEQQKQFESLSHALSEAGSCLRNLLMEYEAVKERLELLKEQHQDLEDEYTKLVEQQLGE